MFIHSENLNNSFNKGYKMKLKNNSLLVKSLLLLLLTPSLGYSAGWTTFNQVANVYSHSTGMILVHFDPRSSHINPDGCKVSSWYAIAPDSLIRDDIYKLLLTAIASGKRARLYLNDCYGSYPKILHANIYNK